MNTTLFDKSSEGSRREAVIAAREDTLGKSLAKERDSDNSRSLLTLDEGENPWLNSPEILADPREYQKAKENISADLSGLLSGAEILTDVAARAAQSQSQELDALERAVATLESDVFIAEALMQASIVGPETWFPSWIDGRDPLFQSNEPGLNTDVPPPPASVDIKTGLLTLPVISSSLLYGESSPGRLRILRVAGGDLINPTREKTGDFEFFPLKIHSKSSVDPSKEYIPWMDIDQIGAALLARVDLNSPGSFSRVSFSAGGRYNCKPGWLFWYPFGNEGSSSILTDSTFYSTFFNLSDKWTSSGSGVSCIQASGSTGPNAGIRLTDTYLSGPLSALLILKPGDSQVTVSGNVYTTVCSASKSFTPPSEGRALRMSVRWRGLGRHISGQHGYVYVNCFRSDGMLTFTNSFKLSDGLAKSNVPAAGEFSLSRYLIYYPDDTTSCTVVLSAQRPDNIDDALGTSMIEVAQVSIDIYAGKRNVSDWREPVAGTPGSHPAYVVNIEKLPESAFFELSYSQEAYEKAPDSEGFYGREYDLSLRSLSIEGIEYARVGRWNSMLKRFNGEPRRFQLIDDQDLGNVDVRISLRPGEKSFPIIAGEPLQIISSEEESGPISSNIVTYTPREEIEHFNGGTDLSGRIRLRYYPYSNKETILNLGRQLAQNDRAIDYDPNAVHPLIYMVEE